VGYNATLTLQTDSSKKQTRSGVLPMKPIKTSSRIHPVSQECLQRLCDDPTTTLCIFSGSERNRLSQTFAHLPKLWIAAENGCFIRPPLEGKHGQLGSSGGGKWITMVETSNLDWLESVQLVFDYFCERTPRSYVETRETSLVWSYKYADPDFGRQQARDLLQHLWTGPISNAAVDVIQGAKSVEVRPIGVSKGAAVERIVSMMGECGSSSLIVEGRERVFSGVSDGGNNADGSGGVGVGAWGNRDGGLAAKLVADGGVGKDWAHTGGDMAEGCGGGGCGGVGGSPERREIDFVMCCGHFLGRDEDIFEYVDRCASAFAGANPPHTAAASKGKVKGNNAGPDSKGKGKGRVEGKEKEKVRDERVGGKGRGVSDGVDGKGKGDDGKPSTITTFGTPITCTVGRKRSGAGYYVNDSDDIAELLATLTNSLDDGKGRVELLQFDTESSLGSSRSLADLARQGSMANLLNTANATLSRPGSLADIARMGRNQSVSNISDNSSMDARGEVMNVPSPIGSPAPLPTGT